MAENLTLARPYAEAAFALARAGTRLDAWEAGLARMATVVRDSRVREIVGNPKIAPDQLTEFFIDTVGKLGEDEKNFVRVLVDNERLLVLPEIFELFVDLKNKHQGVKQAHITSAFPLDEPNLRQLIAELEPRFNCKLDVTVSVDPELIGGVRIAVGDEVIDASVRGKLASLAAALAN
jgi:F-type H+-transporting ATPase subunit delta